jgi:hypothetical protein
VYVCTRAGSVAVQYEYLFEFVIPSAALSREESAVLLGTDSSPMKLASE